jgi:hypothetical protein
MIRGKRTSVAGSTKAVELRVGPGLNGRQGGEQDELFMRELLPIGIYGHTKPGFSPLQHTHNLFMLLFSRLSHP